MERLHLQWRSDFLKKPRCVFFQMVKRISFLSKKDTTLLDKKSLSQSTPSLRHLLTLIVLFSQERPQVNLPKPLGRNAQTTTLAPPNALRPTTTGWNRFLVLKSNEILLHSFNRNIKIIEFFWIMIHFQIQGQLRLDWRGLVPDHGQKSQR